MKHIGKMVMAVLGTAAILFSPLFAPHSYAATVTLQPGDILTTNSQIPAIIKVDPLTGDQSIVSSGGSLVSPREIAIASNGNIYVTDHGCSNPRRCTQMTAPAVIKVDPMTGEQTVISQGGFFCGPWGIGIATNGDLLVADECAFIEQTFPAVGGIIRVDPVSGSQTPVSSDGYFRNPRGLAISQNGDILVANVELEHNSIVRINPVTGDQTLVSNGGNFNCSWGIALDASDTILVTDACDIIGGQSSGELIQVDSLTGTQTVISKGDFFNEPVDIAFATNGDILIADAAFLGPGGIIKVNPLTGTQTILSLGGEFNAPLGIAVVPFPYNTPLGTNVSVSPGSKTMLTFSVVTQAGTTSLTKNSSGPSSPTGFSVGDQPTFYNITTTGIYTAPVTVCLAYDSTQYNDLNPARLLHYEDGTWVDVTTSNDTINYVVCGQVNSLSPFVVAKKDITFLGFYQPVDNLPTINIAKAGQAIPIKWSLKDGNGSYISNLANVVNYGYSSLTSCSGTSDMIEQYSNAGSSSLRYDTTANQFILTSKTDKSWAGSCKMFTLILSDGTKHQIKFQFTK